MMIRSKQHGISSRLLLGKLMRMAGADAVLFPSPYGRMGINHEEAQHVKEQLTQELTMKPTFPIPSAGIDFNTIEDVKKDFGKEVIINLGGSVHRYTGGIEEGGKAFIQAIESN